MVRIAILQMRSGIDPEANAQCIAEAARQASDGGARMLFTPEMSGLLDRDRKRAATNLQSEESDVVLARCRQACAETQIWMHLGSLALRSEDGMLVNRGFVIDDAGTIRGRYDKIHLFDVDLPSGESWRESAVYRPGADAVLVDSTPVGRLGLTICYDLRFPALFAELAEAGAHCISVPSAFTVPTGRAHWQVLIRARAIEAGLFMVAAAQGGRHEDGRETYGHSMVVDPWGDVLVDGGDTTGLSFADIDLGKIGQVRARIPAIEHRQPVGKAIVR